MIGKQDRSGRSHGWQGSEMLRSELSLLTTDWPTGWLAGLTAVDTAVAGLATWN